MHTKIQKQSRIRVWWLHSENTSIVMIRIYTRTNHLQMLQVQNALVHSAAGERMSGVDWFGIYADHYILPPQVMASFSQN